VVCGLWFVVFGFWFVVCGLWFGSPLNPPKGEIEWTVIDLRLIHSVV